MKLGPFEITRSSKNTPTKSFKQLSEIIQRERSSSIKNPMTNPQTQLREYKSWVSSCVSLISDTVMSTPFKFYRKDTEEEITSKNHQFHIFTKAIYNPNPLMSFKFIKSFCQTQLDLCGMAMIYKARNALGQVWELWPLNMNDFLYAEDNLQRSNPLLPDPTYYFSINGHYYNFKSDELIILMYSHPSNLFIGASPIQQQAYAADIQTYVEHYERDFFANSARVDGILSSDADILPDKADEIKDRWKEKFQGNFHDVAVLGSGLKFQPMEWANKDLEFLNLVQWSKEMVLAAYRVPSSKLGASDSANRANSVYTDIYFAKESIRPRLSIWDEEITAAVLADYDARIIFRHVDPIPRDRQLETLESRTYLASAPTMTINEFRKRIHNLGPVDGGDIILIKSDLIPLDRLVELTDAKIKQIKEPPKPPAVNGDSQNNPDRHANDTPHVNPDGSDNRDDNPTPGRSFSIHEFEKELKPIWLRKIKEFSEETFDSDFENIFNATIFAYLKLLNYDIDFEDPWIKTFSNKVSQEIQKTMKIDKNLLEIGTNARIVKILHIALRSCINFTRCKIIEHFGLDKEWSVDRGYCIHGTRVKSFTTKQYFQIGDSFMRFPLETFNLDCDCYLTCFDPKVKMVD